jgi:hypothetical protein
MSNFTDFFPAASGGGGGIPKYEEFTSSGTFTPTQALIDAGGRVAYMIVGGGERGHTGSSEYYGGAGGQFKSGYMTLTSTTGCAVTIGAGGTGTNNADGGSSSIAFSSAGGTDITALGGSGLAHPNFAGYGGESRTSGWQLATSPHPGHFGGYGAGGGANYFNAYGGGIRAAQANMGQGSSPALNASDGFVRITWFE